MTSRRPPARAGDDERAIDLLAAASALLDAADLTSALQSVLALARPLSAADGYVIWQCQIGARAWRAAAASGMSDEYQRAVAEALGAERVAVPEHAVVLEGEHPIAAAARDARRREGIATAIVAPVRHRGEPWGALELSYRVAQTFGARELDLVSALAGCVGSAVENTTRYTAAETANRTKDQFLAMLSHELRTPLNAMLGWAGVLQSQPFDPATARRAIEVIERNAKLQAKLVDDLLDISRIISGRLRLDVRRVAFRPIVEAAIEAARGALEAKRLTLTTPLADDVPPVRGDPARLQQVVGNLLSNAVKFTPAGGRIEVTLARTDTGTELRVTDTGRGIGPEFLARIFEPFHQVEPGSARGQGGLGLGLAIARHLVALHGGTIRAESAGDGSGASFIVDLPAAGAATDAAVPERVAAVTRVAREAAPSLRGIRVLVVDDEQDARELLEFVLTNAGADVTSTASVAEALQALDRARPMVIVSDLAMPDADGYVLARHLRARGTDVGAVALSAYARREDAERAVSAGFDLHVAKPIDPEQLVDIVARLARRASRDRSADPA